MPNKPTQDRPVFLALQGGGARGLVHIGGLIAANELGLDIKGVSGTSAGSMVAALVAVGYKGRELVDPEQKNHIFNTALKDTHIKSPKDIFTPGGWRMLGRLRWASELPGKIWGCFSPKLSWKRLMLAYSVVLSVIVVSLMLILGVAIGAYWVVQKHPTFAFCSLFSLGVLSVSTVIWTVWRIQRGLTTVDKVCDFIEAAMRYKLVQKDLQFHKPITFRDLRQAGCIPLKIVATNAENESLELFSYEKTPDVSVAKAVSASACLPVIFEPCKFDFTRESVYGKEKVSGRFLDGGLVSNLPAWPFDEERLLHPEIVTVAFNLAPTEQAYGKHWLPAVIGAVVNGTGEIDTRATGKIIKIALPTTLKMLDFHVDLDRVIEEVAKPISEVSDKLLTELHDFPGALDKAARNVRDVMLDVVQSYDGHLFELNGKPWRVRVALTVQRGDSMRTLSKVAYAGYEGNDPDRGMTVPLDAHDAGLAWKNQRATFHTRKHLAGEPPLKNAVFGWERAWTNMEWRLCIPIAPATLHGKRARPCVVIIDSDIPLFHPSAQTGAILKDFVTGVGDLVRDYNETEGIATFVQGANTWMH
ncbi:patatin-like phospholipase family protein [Pseudomonas coleopterorum]|uniref:patatin-like phospholipase family protein n=1 Tax=Pseudomonas coleopterorum TaxID=1605838 RepID=UPI002A6A725A|nr:patatin-like phospholipase family protein [Pseudomonas coleopterorum]MDY1046958.1 patatin-like phospholipase family protein [Pseudomonas coleopterorum]